MSNARDAIRDSDRGEGGATTESPISNAHYAIRDLNRGHRRALTESIISNARDAIRDNCILAAKNKGVSSSFYDSIAILSAIVGSITTFDHDRSNGIAITESTISNARYAVRDGDRGEGRATIESTTSNARNAIWNGDGGERGTTHKNINSNARYTIGDGDGGEGGATIESIISNARYAVRNDCILTASNEGIGSGFNNCIAVFTTIIYGIAIFNGHRCEGGAISESTFSYARNAIRDGDRGEGGAIVESVVSNVRYAVGNGDRGERGANLESIISNARYAIRDSNRYKTRTPIKSIFSNARYWCIEGNRTYSIFINVAYDVCAKSICIIWSYDTIISGGVIDLLSFHTILYKLAYIFCPIGCLVCGK